MSFLQAKTNERIINRHPTQRRRRMEQLRRLEMQYVEHCMNDRPSYPRNEHPKMAALLKGTKS